jgi:hypothetical protein
MITLYNEKIAALIGVSSSAGKSKTEVVHRRSPEGRSPEGTFDSGQGFEAPGFNRIEKETYSLFNPSDYSLGGSLSTRALLKAFRWRLSLTEAGKSDGLNAVGFLSATAY